MGSSAFDTTLAQSRHGARGESQTVRLTASRGGILGPGAMIVDEAAVECAQPARHFDDV